MQRTVGTAAAEPPAKCPRCESTNTKFCYYNNYNLSQPRHFCKACRRYWTKGGALRNVPVGGGSRKNSKRASSSSSNSSSGNPAKRATTTVAVPELHDPVSINPHPPGFDSDHGMLDIAGSFSSLLGANCQYGGFVEGLQAGDVSLSIGGAAAGAPLMGLDLQQSSTDSSGKENQAAVVAPENFFVDWAGGWPNLAIYTPGSGFQ